MECGRNGNPTLPAPRRVMVVVEPTREAAGALQYALCHGVVERDELILLYVDSPNSWRNTLSTLFRQSGVIAFPAGGGTGSTSGSFTFSYHGVEGDFLEETRRVCKAAQPSVRVRTERVEMEGGRDKASMILLQSKLHGVDVLIIGQRRSLSTAILGSKRQGSSLRGVRVADTAEYLIENCSCACVAVQRKGQNAGYLLNTKTFRNFWLLA
ncbi:uncharacterized protein LOC116192289 [Punica granatum]|uniref:UspA domain-containing protein n=2 Tax=Punica granatum TaxID=22663 RepID=A0A218VS15_PUNGR|nr:uncharacterized protein LOC116192289 [Punica granatum]OWM63295.1 hypothetical protein CDL15_Pgr022040 [Punica granatum]PKI70036.1 hypothetical protein CRG98_009499 [Punica granatum]